MLSDDNQGAMVDDMLQVAAKMIFVYVLNAV